MTIIHQRGGAWEAGVGRKSLQSLVRIEKMYREVVPRYIFRALAGGMYREGRAFLKSYRATFDRRFKTGGKQVANSFRLYTAGEPEQGIDNLEMGIFTRWKAAELYEEGGVIRSKMSGGWLPIPVTDRAYTANGRVKRSWRNAHGGFKREHFKNIKWVQAEGKPLVYGYREIKASTNKHGRLRRNKVRTEGTGNAYELVWVMIKSTRRKPTLEFAESFTAWFGRGGRRLQAAVNRALDAAVRWDSPSAA